MKLVLDGKSLKLKNISVYARNTIVCILERQVIVDTVVLLFKERVKMPLKKSKSKVAFKQNVAAEVNVGKPVKQAVAIAFSVKRKAGKKK